MEVHVENQTTTVQRNRGGSGAQRFKEAGKRWEHVFSGAVNESRARRDRIHRTQKPFNRSDKFPMVGYRVNAAWERR